MPYKINGKPAAKSSKTFQHKMEKKQNERKKYKEKRTKQRDDKNTK